MPVDDIKPTDALRHYIGNEQDQSKHRPSYGGGRFTGKRKYPAPKRNINDVTSFMNIPQDELTPAVTEAISSLMEEVEELREELSMTQHFEQKLSATLDKHMDLPVLTRHALMREVAVIAAQTQRSGAQATFIYFQIRNFAEIKKRFGLLAGETVIRETAQILQPQLRETDRVGTLGGDGFGIVMALSDVKHALEKVRHLENLVKRGPIMHGAHILDVEVAYGLHSLHLTEEIDTILHETDKDLHRRFVRL
ncbi:diguanylate cyclase [Terasakiella sp. SH-1]|uniref:GGDEF domain-containing protein n=1 Tax=Terasakiella sp. SH-1 TaxID=2560057 RepID=UPI001073071C|nr:diguanylate cyclase [Terasakiella sp. SH-1]